MRLRIYLLRSAHMGNSQRDTNEAVRSVLVCLCEKFFPCIHKDDRQIKVWLHIAAHVRAVGPGRTDQQLYIEQPIAASALIPR